ncbi:hypothetical protein HX862_13655 [Pseudomonas sp. D5002]|uniref:hypothetical protein n=1 Tax=Pseudomonas TaxID=286 RepID=UPI0014875A1B|nr:MULTISPECIES: hypothetical protein [Pseudomonas]NWB08952.1 hypothetical protein [Pseudomonas sp. D5002]
MADNYVKKTQFAGLEQDEDGQVRLKAKNVEAEALVRVEPQQKAARKNGGGDESK